jgi:hypothetical protein
MKPLVQVQFRHGYFSSRLCTVLLVTPSDTARRTMTDHGLWWKANPGGFTLLYDTLHAGAPRTRDAVLNDRIVLRWLIRLQDPYFYNYTAAPAAIPSREILYFFNQPGAPRLYAGNIPCGHFGKPFAILGLRLRPWTENNYHIEFQPQSATWRYILVSPHLQQLNNPAVINSVTRERFKGPSGIQLIDGRPALSFVSPAPISCSQRPAATCMLVENFDPATGRHKVIMPVLPVPDPRIISRSAATTTNNETAAGPPDNFSEILIY